MRFQCHFLGPVALMIGWLACFWISVCEWESVNSSRAREQRGDDATVHSHAQALRPSHL